MSSNIEVQKICEECGSEFTARTTATRYCSHSCNGKAYKRKLSQSKVQKVTAETVKIKTQDLDLIKAKELLSVSEMAALIGCSKRTAYRLVATQTITAVNFAQRMTRVRRSDIDAFASNSNTAKVSTPPKNEESKKLINLHR